MAEITCPECGHQTELVSIRRSSEEFCTHCDFPLFWVSSNVPTTTKGANSDSTLRRLPGAGGRNRVGSKVCPECGELNPLGTTHCIRCTAELDPKPAPPPVVVVAAPPPPPPPEPEPEPEPITTPWWWWPAAALIASAIAIPILASL
jgi:ribosomal protein L40E